MSEGIRPYEKELPNGKLEQFEQQTSTGLEHQHKINIMSPY